MQLDDLVALCKRRGFVYNSSSIYGGLQGFFDYGPLGVELRNNIKTQWWKHIVYLRDDVYGLDSAVVLNEAVVRYSGHADTFVDMLIDCFACKSRFRDDEMKDGKCPKCGSKNCSKPRAFNLMMQVPLGPTHEVHGVLRPETAQGVFINFKNICNSYSPKLPFGIAQIGKAFRNEITPRNFVFRMREFEQMELEYFIRPDMQDEMFDYWVNLRVQWWKSLSIDVELRQQEPNELAHYSKYATDIMFRFPHGLEELEGIANRGDYDLGSHTKNQQDYSISAHVKKNIDSVEKLNYEDFIPCIVETSAGVDRAFLAVLASAYCIEKIGDESRTVLKLHPLLAPIKAAILPLVRNNEQIVEKSRQLFANLKQKALYPIALEAGGNVGKSYRKHDEIGTPMAITIDYQTLEDNTVTIRDRDSMQQHRVAIDQVFDSITDKLNNF